MDSVRSRSVVVLLMQLELTRGVLGDVTRCFFEQIEEALNVRGFPTLDVRCTVSRTEQCTQFYDIEMPQSLA